MHRRRFNRGEMLIAFAALFVCCGVAFVAGRNDAEIRVWSKRVLGLYPPPPSGDPIVYVDPPWPVFKRGLQRSIFCSLAAAQLLVVFPLVTIGMLIIRPRPLRHVLLAGALLSIALAWGHLSDQYFLSLRHIRWFLYADVHILPTLLAAPLCIGWVLIARRITKPRWRRALARQALLEGMCPRCGYNLTGNPSGICPECGRAFRDDILPQAPGWQ